MVSSSCLPSRAWADIMLTSQPSCPWWGWGGGRGRQQVYESVGPTGSLASSAFCRWSCTVGLKESSSVREYPKTPSADTYTHSLTATWPPYLGSYLISATCTSELTEVPLQASDHKRETEAGNKRFPFPSTEGNISRPDFCLAVLRPNFPCSFGHLPEGMKVSSAALQMHPHCPESPTLAGHRLSLLRLQRPPP